MTDLLKKLHEVGFTPLNIALAIALIVVWRVLIARDKDQTKTREEWHAETRAQLAEVQKHTEECNRERAALKKQVDQVEGELNLRRRCNSKDCPMRLPE